MAVISVEDFIRAGSKEVEIPGFSKDETITVRLQKVSLMGMISGDKVPNELLGVVLDLFKGKKQSDVQKVNQEELAEQLSNDMNVDEVKAMSSFINLICTCAMVEPTYEQIGNYMSDDQKNAVFNFAYEPSEAKQLSTFSEN